MRSWLLTPVDSLVATSVIRHPPAAESRWIYSISTPLRVREAGVIPALSRNCERGVADQGSHWDPRVLGRRSAAMIRKPGDLPRRCYVPPRATGTTAFSGRSLQRGRSQVPLETRNEEAPDGGQRDTGPDAVWRGDASRRCL